MGGQTALNCALDLARDGVLEKYGVEMIGATQEAIDKAEDREKFKDGDDAASASASARSALAHTLEEALQVQAMRRLPGGDPAVVHAGRHRRRHRLQPRGVRRHLRARPRRLADARNC